MCIRLLGLLFSLLWLMYWHILVLRFSSNICLQETSSPLTVTRFGPKVGQIGPKWGKSGKFSDQIQYILAHREIYFGAKSGNRATSWPKNLVYKQQVPIIFSLISPHCHSHIVFFEESVYTLFCSISSTYLCVIN